MILFSYSHEPLLEILLTHLRTSQSEKSRAGGTFCCFSSHVLSKASVSSRLVLVLLNVLQARRAV